MRLVWQLVAVAAVAFLGGQGLAAVDGNPWLTLEGRPYSVLFCVLATIAFLWLARRRGNLVFRRRRADRIAATATLPR
ncbi:hypothetical protein AB0H34_39180 [Saccharopolyspora shandongensis]|uniref:hypothetical protein n=1 Tax=Saccharopolyspora shandongensis TaxID=418495 RepID=UPI0033C3371C